MLVVCVAAWAGIWFSGDPDSDEVLYRHGAASAWKIWDGAWWSLITSAFVHVDLIHLFFNMYWLWILGRPMERAVGSLRLFAFVVLAAFVSSAVELAVSDNAGIGFSGVLYALFGFMWIARRRYPAFLAVVTQQVVRILLAWLVLCFFLDAAGIWNIGNAAHVSGLAFGVLLGYAVLPTPKRAAAIAAVAVLTLASVVPPFWMPWSGYWAGYNASQAHSAKRYDDAVHWYRRALELGHHNPQWAWKNIAKIQYFGDEHEALAQTLRDVRKFDSSVAERLRCAFEGYTAYKQKRWKAAAHLYQRSLDLGEDMRFVAVGLVQAYTKLRDEKGRKWAIRRLRKLHPDVEVPPAAAEKEPAD
ncbi:MAG: rhomboid family intramembrane serine protease [Planctomycetota bacterium]|nr:rhomboid family intramembrane serine protease [Planctomycetota bacterium]